MQPITREHLAANAYRTLGLSASASQSMIEAAARRMRIWPDPAHIPPTPWDLPNLGPLRRSKSDIEQAVAALHQPLPRLQHRLLWFGTESPPQVGAPNGAPVDQHALLVKELHSMFAAADVIGTTNRWQNMLEQVSRTCASPELSAWTADVERAGQFEKAATADEVEQVLAAVPPSVAAGLVTRAMEAFEHSRIEVVKSIAAALASVPVGSDALLTLLDRLEDDFVNHVAEMDHELRDKLGTDRSDPAPYYQRNREQSQLSAYYYNKHIAPTMSVLFEPALATEDRSDRVKSRAAELLVLLALGWEWAGAPGEAERVLQIALQLATGTVTEREVRVALDRVIPQARAARGRWSLPSPATTYLPQPKLRRRCTNLSADQRQKTGITLAAMIVGLVVWLQTLLKTHYQGPSLQSTPGTLTTPMPPSIPSIPNPTSVRDPDPPPPFNESTGEVNREP